MLVPGDFAFVVAIQDVHEAPERLLAATAHLHGTSCLYERRLRRRKRVSSKPLARRTLRVRRVAADG